MKTYRTIGALAVSLTAAYLLSACSAGSMTSVPGAVPPPALGRHAAGSLELRIRVPRRKRRPKYVSAGTKGLTLALTGPTAMMKTVSLQPTAPGCTSTPTATSCALTIPALKPCKTGGNCYSATIATYNAIAGCPSACSVAGAQKLSSNSGVAFRISAGKKNTISITLDGIPSSVAFLPASNSSLTGGVDTGYALSKCGSDSVSVFGVDAAGYYILGQGAPVVSLTSDDTAHLAVSTPKPASPNEFTIVRPSPPPNANSVVHLTAGASPLAGASPAKPVTTGSIAMTFNSDVCGVFTMYPLSTGTSPNDITVGSDGNMWFVEYGSAKVAKMTTSGVLLNEFPAGDTQPATIVTGSDAHVWYTTLDESIGKMTTTGTATVYPIATPVTNPTPFPTGIAAGPDGNVWFVEDFASLVGNITTAGAVTTFSAGASMEPFKIAAGPDDQLWFTEASQIGSVTTSGTVTQHTSGITGFPSNIVAGPDGAMWFTEPTSDKIGRIATDGSPATEFPITTNSFPVAITVGPDGAIWFTETESKKIGRMTTDGVVAHEYDVPTTNTNDIVTMVKGPDGALWFVETVSNKIGRLR